MQNMTASPGICDCNTLERSTPKSPNFTYDQHMRHFIHSHNNDISSGVITTLVGTGLGYYSSKVVRACGVMIGIGILGLEVLSRFEWAMVDWYTITDELVLRSKMLTGSPLGPFTWSWSRRGFISGLLIGFSLENLF